MVYSCDRRHSEMSRQEIDILMNDRWALLCVFIVSAWHLLAVTCCYCCCWCSAVISVWQVRVEPLDRTVTVWQSTELKGRRDLKIWDDMLSWCYKNRTSITALDLIHIWYLQPIKGSLCGGEWNHAHFRMPQMKPNLGLSYWWRCHHGWGCGSPVWQQHFSEDLDPLTDLRLFCPFFSQKPAGQGHIF